MQPAMGRNERELRKNNSLNGLGVNRPHPVKKNPIFGYLGSRN